MEWTVVSHIFSCRFRRCRLPAAYTLVEILVATTLSLMLLGAVVRMFGEVGEGITDSRAMLEAADRLRVVQTRLQQDLDGITVTMNPPRSPESNEGYFEYIEGPITQLNASNYAADTSVLTSGTTTKDTTVGDFDDILMFTTRSSARPFVGKYNGGAIQSDVAEVAWFLRGRTLHRRVLLVAPSVGPISATNFYACNDISVHPNSSGTPIANTLSDLTNRECRFAHGTATFPYDARGWAWQCPAIGSGTTLFIPTLPTLNECSCGTSTTPWSLNRQPSTAGSMTTSAPLDFWTNSILNRMSDCALHGSTATGTRIADDVILTNVIGFDVKAWDPIYQGYVDLGYGTTTYASAGNYVNSFYHFGHPQSSTLVGSANTAKVYDTWSTSYESDGVQQPTASVSTVTDAGTNGFDDDSNGVVDDVNEKETSPPYPIPLRGIQVKIRIFEPDSRQIREVTVVRDFLPQ